MSKIQHKILNNVDENGFEIRYEADPPSYIPPHWHQAVELLLFVSGQVTCYLENATFQLKAGDIFIINAHEVHATLCSPDASYLVVHILPQLMCKYVPAFDQMRFSLTFDPEDQEKVRAFEQMKVCMWQMHQQTEENHPASKLERKAKLFAVTALLVRHFSMPLALEKPTLQRGDMTRLEPVLEYIQMHHEKDLSLDSAAETIGLNREYFCRLFKKNMGISFLQYVYQVRTAAFCRDLENTEDTIGEIADRHGFRDPKMLNQYFKELYGCTPSEKRKFFREVSLRETQTGKSLKDVL